MTKSNLRYHEFKDKLDLDNLYDELGFEVLGHVKGEDQGYCLFPDNHAHGDQTGKMFINREKKVYICWVCGGGSILDLVMQVRDCTSEEATFWLRQFAFEDGRSESEFVNDMLKMLYPEPDEPSILPYFNEAVLNKFNGPTDYFNGRGISDQVIQECNLKYGLEVTKTAPRKNKNGVVEKIDVDYVGPAAIFPHYWGGQLVGWQHRWINYPDTPKWLAKYTNTTSFPKEHTLFNWDYASRHGGPVVVVESVPTALFLRSLDIPSVSYFGSEPSGAQLKLLRSLIQGVILAPDNDANGDRLLNKATPYLEKYIDVFHVPKVGGPKDDLGDYAQYENGGEMVKQHLELAEPSYLATSET